MNKIPYESKVLDVFEKREHKAPEYTAIIPEGVIPGIQEVSGSDTFSLSESHTILRYIADEYGAADNWYPKDLRQRALVNRYLDSHHGDLRYGATGYLTHKIIKPAFG